MLTPLDKGANVLVTVEDPPWFEQVVRDWERYGNTADLDEEERNFEGRTSRTEEERLRFASEIRDLGHQADLELADQHPVFSVAITPPGGFPVMKRNDSGAIHVTRKAREQIETGPMAAIRTTQPQPAISMAVSDVPADDPDRD